MRRLRLVAVAAVALVLVAGAVFAVASRWPLARLTALPQPPDSDAPAGAPPHWIPSEEWVMQHWLPYDERRLLHLLQTDRATVWRHLRDDRRTLASLAAERGWPDTARLAQALVAPRRATLSAADARTLERRAVRTLTQGHLAQHIVFHSLHQDAVPDHAREIFGVPNTDEFQRLRRLDISPVQIGRMYGRSRAEMHDMAVARLRERAHAGVAAGAMSRHQGRLLLGRQLRQLPRWLAEEHYNGPPRTDRTGRVLERLRPAWAAPAIDDDGSAVVLEAYEPDLALAKQRGEISVVGWSEAGGTGSPLSHRARSPLHAPFSAYNPQMSGDGRWVIFETSAGNRNFAKRYGNTGVVLADRRTGRLRMIGRAPAGGRTRTAYAPAISGDGRVIAVQATFADDRAAAGGSHATRVLVGSRRGGLRAVPDAGTHAGLRAGPDAYEPSLSGDGRLVAYSALSSAADGSHVSHIYVYDRRTHSTMLVSRAGPVRADGESWSPRLSRDGRYIAFASTAGNLGRGRPTAGESRIYVHDLRRDRTRLVSVQGRRLMRGFASEPAIAADGSAVAFALAPLAAHRAGDGRPSQHVYVRDLRAGTTELVSRSDAAGRSPAEGYAAQPAISADGARVAFTSDALGAGRRRGQLRVFLRDVSQGRTVRLRARSSYGAAASASGGAEPLCHLAPPAW